MFKKLASDVMGLSDIGKIIDPSDYDKVDSDDYVMHEDGEKIFFLIKSKSDEYCFTNTALIHLDGDSAMNSKRVLKRITYKSHTFSDVKLETAGNIDLDVEIKFRLGDESYSIDVDKKQIEKLKDLYKSLIKIASIQDENAKKLDMSDESLSVSINALKGAFGSNVSKSEFASLNEYVYDWKVAKHHEFHVDDFSEVFEKYILN
ncbi:PH domain-containing protein [Sediminitomix flava]|uniref:YvbH-like protein n=1 Tax=Sediminitomix flava TaxID=379075 RepID=A0A315ZFD6_SEDFL|nr:PH domain-containing protein [Sediminitomix flava]PWJ44275.1 YvbH-like protein [Sediminitomix flava]